MFILRQIEKIYKNNLFSRRDDEGAMYYFPIEAFPSLARTKMTFSTKRGDTLTGYFYYLGELSSYSKDRLIVFDHGIGVGHRVYMKEIDMLTRHGYLVYTYDHTGCTESEGEHIMGLSGSLADLDSCIDALVSEGYAEESISVVGHSWGGYSTLNILAFHNNIRSIVAMSGFISVSAMHRQLLPLVLRPFASALYRLEEEANPDYAPISAIDTLSQTDSEALIIHSLDDSVVSAKWHFLPLREALSDRPNLEFLALKGKVHNPAYDAEAVKYKAAFFRKQRRRVRWGMHKKNPEAHRAFLMSYDYQRMTVQDDAVWDRIYAFLDK